MSAQDKFESFNASLSPNELVHLKELIASKGVEILAARSEDERVRLVEEYIRDIREELLRRR